jgi:hypothetical protein
MTLRLNSRGYGFVELCIAMLILTFFAEMLAVGRLVMAKKTVALEDQSYARLNAIQMMEELKSLANQNPGMGPRYWIAIRTRMGLTPTRF